MEVRAIDFVVSACAGELMSGSPAGTVSRVCTDSRQAQSGDLFVALRGERFDAHDFISEAAKKAAAVVLERRSLKDRPLSEIRTDKCAVIAVDDTRAALGRLAGVYRKQFQLPIAVVAGSNGKTTTKELVAAVLRQRLVTLASEASFNNDIGVPLTLLSLQRSHQAAVLEAGTNHPGELAPLVRTIHPDYGILTGIGREHLEFFGDLDGVAEEEGWLAELLPSRGKLFLNTDSEWADRIARRTQATVVRIGSSEESHWRLVAARLEKQGTMFRVEAPQADLAGEYRVRLIGKHQALNAVFALALGAELGLSRSEIEQGLLECKPAKMRMQLWTTSGVQVLDDCYNANADSMLVALATLRELPCRGRRVAVLGDMAEQGPHSPAAHHEVGRRAAESGVGQLFAVGKMAPLVASAARDAGLTRVLEFADVETAASAVKQFVREGDLVLLKASRSSRLERIGEALRAGEKKVESEVMPR
jgi:UDP-N-acetylmuramoyl-tripeptide--D-alanyl-D-alanine ligase